MSKLVSKGVSDKLNLVSKFHSARARTREEDPDFKRYLGAFLATNGSDRDVAEVMGCSDKTVANRYRKPFSEQVKGYMIAIKTLRRQNF